MYSIKIKKYRICCKFKFKFELKIINYNILDYLWNLHNFDNFNRYSLTLSER